MIGYAATSAINSIDGDTMVKASFFSESPRERCRCCGGAPWIVAVSAMALEGRERLLDLRLRRLQRVLGLLLPRECGVDVRVDRLRDLRIDRRDRARPGLLDRLLQHGGIRQRLLDRGLVVRRRRR